MDTGDPITGRIPRHEDRALPSPSPTANLVGVWKGNGQRREPLHCQRFFCSLLRCPHGGVVLNGRESAVKGVIKSLGLVFGDIGTSPIYTLTVIILLTTPTEAHVVGVLSLIV